jgi:hypothetical protein
MDPPVTGHVVRFVEGERPPSVAVNEARGKGGGKLFRGYG